MQIRNDVTIRETLRSITWAVRMNLLFALVISWRYLLTPTSWPATAWAWVYALTTWIGHFAFLIAVLGLIAFPILCLVRVRVVQRILLASVATCLQLILIGDTVTFHQYRFHINSLVLDMILKGRGQIIVFGPRMWAIAIGVTFVIWLVEFFVLDEFDFRGCSRKVGTRFWWGALGCFVCLLISHSMSVIGEAFHYSPISSQFHVFPLMAPLQATTFLREHGWVDTEKYKKQDQFEMGSNQILHYPLEQMVCHPPKKKMNLLFLMSDALRADILDPKIMPSVSQLAAQSQVFENHISGSNSTRHGVYSVFYGIPGSYFESMKQTKTGPVLIDQMLLAGYQMGIFGSATVTMPEFDQTVFAKIPNLYEAKGGADYERDLDITNQWLKFLDHADSKRPFFGYLFYDSTHGPDSPDDFPKPFQPSWDAVNYLELSENSDPTPFLNRYKNSVYFVDSLMGRVIADLKRRGLYESTIIIVTSDHGQEFNDNHLGYWGHNSNFSETQVHVPMVIHWPGMAPQTYEQISTHADIAPTLLQNVLDCSTDPRSYSSGWNLFERKGHPWIYSGTFDFYGIYTPHDLMTVHFPSSYEMTDHHLVHEDNDLDPRITEAVFNEMSRFFRSDAVDKNQ